MPGLELRPIVPAFIVAVTGLFVLLVQAFTPRGKAAPSAPLSLFGLAAALTTVVLIARERTVLVTGGTIVADRFALLLQGALIAITMVVVLLSPSYLRATGSERGEYYSLVLFSLVGMLGLVSAVELISLFVALEIMSVALYALTGLHRDRLASQEAALKYFITGSFSSAFFLYGVALLYGASGSTMLSRLQPLLTSPPEGLALLPILGLGLMLVGFAFKVASVPFHAWAPDVYEGAPTTVTAFMAAGVKAAAFGAFLRVFGAALPEYPSMSLRWRMAIASLALVTMILGNLGALVQRSVKRMLAFSSIAHAGYVLTAFVAVRYARPGSEDAGTVAILFYVIAYAAVNIGGFGAIAALARGGREPLNLDDFNGLAERRPALAAAVTVFLISLTGVPISAGFVGKFYLFKAAVDAGYIALAIVGVITSVISAYYYLSIVVAMYMREPAGEDTWAPMAWGSRVALALSAFVVLGLGVYPAPLLDLAREAAKALGQ
jgi:NADH-quinone oxidoreductase subunit N